MLVSFYQQGTLDISVILFTTCEDVSGFDSENTVDPFEEIFETWSKALWEPSENCYRTFEF